MRDLSLTRRRALVGAALLGAAGCSTTTTPSATPVRSAAASPTASASLSVDEQIVSDLVGRLGAATDQLAAARSAYPTLPLAALLTAERAHLSTLRAAVTAGRLPLATPSATPLPATADAALAQVREQTTSLQQVCLDAAGRAESGAFARLLASMGCALAQRLAVLPS